MGVEELVIQCVEEIAIHGNSGLTPLQLFQLVETSTKQPINIHVRNYIHRKLLENQDILLIRANDQKNWKPSNIHTTQLRNTEVDSVIVQPIQPKGIDYKNTLTTTTNNNNNQNINNNNENNEEQQQQQQQPQIETIDKNESSSKEIVLVNDNIEAKDQEVKLIEVYASKKMNSVREWQTPTKDKSKNNKQLVVKKPDESPNYLDKKVYTSWCGEDGEQRPFAYTTTPKLQQLAYGLGMDFKPNEIQWKILEMVGASKYKGTPQRDISERYNIDPRNIFHPIKILGMRGLIKKIDSFQSFAKGCPISTKRLYLTKYFDKRDRDISPYKSSTQNIENLFEELESRENKIIRSVQLFNMLPQLGFNPTTYKKQKKKLKEMGFLGTLKLVVDGDNNLIPGQSLEIANNNNKDEEEEDEQEEPKSKQKNRKSISKTKTVEFIKLLRPWDPSAFEKDDADESKEDQEEEEIVGEFKTCSMTHETDTFYHAYQFIKSFGQAGCMSTDLYRSIGGSVTKKIQLMYIKALVHDYGLKLVPETKGKQLEYRFIIGDVTPLAICPPPSESSQTSSNTTTTSTTSKSNHAKEKENGVKPMNLDETSTIDNNNNNNNNVPKSIKKSDGLFKTNSSNSRSKTTLFTSRQKLLLDLVKQHVGVLHSELGKYLPGSEGNYDLKTLLKLVAESDGQLQVAKIYIQKINGSHKVSTLVFDGKYKYGDPELYKVIQKTKASTELSSNKQDGKAVLYNLDSNGKPYSYITGIFERCRFYYIQIWNTFKNTLKPDESFPKECSVYFTTVISELSLDKYLRFFLKFHLPIDQLQPYLDQKAPIKSLPYELREKLFRGQFKIKFTYFTKILCSLDLIKIDTFSKGINIILKRDIDFLDKQYSLTSLEEVNKLWYDIKESALNPTVDLKQYEVKLPQIRVAIMWGQSSGMTKRKRANVYASFTNERPMTDEELEEIGNNHNLNLLKIKSLYAMYLKSRSKLKKMSSRNIRTKNARTAINRFLNTEKLDRSTRDRVQQFYWRGGRDDILIKTAVQVFKPFLQEQTKPSSNVTPNGIPTISNKLWEEVAHIVGMPADICYHRTKLVVSKNINYKYIFIQHLSYGTSSLSKDIPDNIHDFYRFFMVVKTKGEEPTQIYTDPMFDDPNQLLIKDRIMYTASLPIEIYTPSLAKSINPYDPLFENIIENLIQDKVINKTRDTKKFQISKSHDQRHMDLENDFFEMNEKFKDFALTQLEEFSFEPETSGASVSQALYLLDIGSLVPYIDNQSDLELVQSNDTFFKDQEELEGEMDVEIPQEPKENKELPTTKQKRGRKSKKKKATRPRKLLPRTFSRRIDTKLKNIRITYECTKISFESTNRFEEIDQGLIHNDDESNNNNKEERVNEFLEKLQIAEEQEQELISKKRQLDQENSNNMMDIDGQQQQEKEEKKVKTLNSSGSNDIANYDLASDLIKTYQETHLQSKEMKDYFYQRVMVEGVIDIDTIIMQVKLLEHVYRLVQESLSGGTFMQKIYRDLLSSGEHPQLKEFEHEYYNLSIHLNQLRTMGLIQIIHGATKKHYIDTKYTSLNMLPLDNSILLQLYNEQVQPLSSKMMRPWINPKGEYDKTEFTNSVNIIISYLIHHPGIKNEQLVAHFKFLMPTMLFDIMNYFESLGLIRIEYYEFTAATLFSKAQYKIISKAEAITKSLDNPSILTQQQYIPTTEIVNTPFNLASYIGIMEL